MYRVIESRIDPPSRWRADVSPALEAVVMRGLRKTPSERFATASAMADAMVAACPPAGREAVTRWLSETAGPELARRESLVAAIEADPVDTVTAPTATTLVVDAPVIQVSTLSAFHPVSRVLDGERHPRATPVLAAAALVLLFLVVPLAATHRAPAPPAPLPAAAPALDTAPPVAILEDAPTPSEAPPATPSPTPSITPVSVPTHMPAPTPRPAARSPRPVSDRIYQRD
jgi:serine/threonine-protein kinase